MLVEFVVLFLLHILLRPLPKRRHRIERLWRFFILLPAVLLLLRQALEKDRIGDEVGILFDKLADAPLVEILKLILAQMEHYRSAGHVASVLGHRVGAASRGFPAPGGGLSALARNNAHAVGHHERRIESNAELADQLGGAGGAILLDRLAKRLGAGRGDHPEVLLEVLRVHASSVIGDHQRLRIAVGDDVDPPFGVVGHEGLVDEPLVSCPVDRVGGVGDEFAEEYFLLRVQRIDHEVEHFAHLGLE